MDTQPDRPWRVVTILLMLAVICVSTGCSRQKVHYVPMAEPFSGWDRYRVLEVEPVKVPAGELERLMDKGGLITTRRAFLEEFKEHDLLPTVVGSCAQVDSVLLVRTTVATWDPGDAGARFFVGFVGAAELALHVALVDKASQTCIGETTFTMKEAGDGCDAGAMGRKMAPSVRSFIEKRGR